MFSEYASRFLAQSQSHIVSRPDERRRKDCDRITQQPGSSRYLSSHSFLQRRPADPYQPGASQFSNFAFGSRNLAQQAPLFHSATEDLHEEDEEAEHEREIADFYALQRSRRHFGSSYLRDSGTDEDDNNSIITRAQNTPDRLTERTERGPRGLGRRSRFGRARDWSVDAVAEAADGEEDIFDGRKSRTIAKLVDVRLEDTLKSDLHDSDGDLPGASKDDKPPAVQRFREEPRTDDIGMDSNQLLDDTSQQRLLDESQLPTADAPQTSTESGTFHFPSFDAFWGHLFLISLACLFATSFLIYLNTSPPGNKSTWGDTIYLTIHGSFYRLGMYTVVSVCISLLWLALLRSYVRPLVYVTMFAVPVILYSFSLYPFISSFRGAWHGSSVQDRVMRFGSFVPFIMATAWIYNVIRSRHVIGKAISILEFACRILAANAELLLLGLGNLILIVTWTWVWMLMFTRVFLGGHKSGPSETKAFTIDISSWWLGSFFIIVYLWSLGIIAGVQRAVTAATVSQWYFHRLAVPAPTSRQIVQAAALHSLTTLFGTICLSRLLALLIRIPFLVLPRRLASVLSLFTYTFVPTPITTLTDPLSLTYAAIHSQPLAASARGLTQMTNIAPSVATSSLHPRSFSQTRETYSPLLPYKLSKLILHAARLMMSLALGFGGWVSTARSLGVPTSSHVQHGSMYAYVVGLIAATIGWSVLEAIEGIVADIVDASIICYSSEVGLNGRDARYCREAGWLFGKEPSPEPRYSVEP
ncbi:hypothetical protein BJY04DRAFT_189184 [Aspergillus karnatakaensis]|uniref:uncharacterized protein n=1 Tax=Aspergillus karnatakaensis TaxID=1810916 RepID=UPI003CCDC370